MTMEANKTDISIWKLFMVSSMQAALHMDPSYTDSEFENIESLFNITSMMSGENSEIMNVSSLEASRPTWERST